jgi:hypothetical protein
LKSIQIAQPYVPVPTVVAVKETVEFATAVNETEL